MNTNDITLQLSVLHMQLKVKSSWLQGRILKLKFSELTVIQFLAVIYKLQYPCLFLSYYLQTQSVKKIQTYQ